MRSGGKFLTVPTNLVSASAPGEFASIYWERAASAGPPLNGMRDSWSDSWSNALTVQTRNETPTVVITYTNCRLFVLMHRPATSSAWASTCLTLPVGCLNSIQSIADKMSFGSSYLFTTASTLLRESSGDDSHETMYSSS